MRIARKRFSARDDVGTTARAVYESLNQPYVTDGRGGGNDRAAAGRRAVELRSSRRVVVIWNIGVSRGRPVLHGSRRSLVVLAAIAVVGANAMGHARQLRTRHVDDCEEQCDDLDDA